MKRYTLKSMAVAASISAGIMGSSAVHAAQPSVRTLAAEEARLATIAYRIAIANVDRCSAREVVTGLILHDVTRYAPSLRPTVSAAFSMTGGFGVLEVVPGSPAAEAGVRIDDEILAIGNSSVDDTAAVADKPASYDRMQRFNALVDTAIAQGTTSLTVRRAGKIVRLPLRIETGCGGKVALKYSGSANAWADGEHVVVTTGMSGFSRSEDEIAFVVAHEMAHNILGHSKGTEARGIFGSLARVKRGEIEADAFAVQLMARAGYDPSGSIRFLANARRRLWWNLSLDHPGFGSRIRTIETVMAQNRASHASLAGRAVFEPVELLTRARESRRR